MFFPAALLLWALYAAVAGPGAVTVVQPQ